MSGWFKRTFSVPTRSLLCCFGSCALLPLSSPRAPSPTSSCSAHPILLPSPPPPPLLQSVRRSVQCRAVRGAEDRGFMVFSPEEHLIQGQRVKFNCRMESLFPVMQPSKHTYTHIHNYHTTTPSPPTLLIPFPAYVEIHHGRVESILGYCCGSHSQGYFLKIILLYLLHVYDIYADICSKLDNICLIPDVEKGWEYFHNALP